MEEHAMADSSDRTSQIHVRVPREFKKALKIFCVREGTTEQAWLSELIEAELKSKAPDLWSENLPSKEKEYSLLRQAGSYVGRLFSTLP
jgi:hypothetical protein